MKKQLGVVLFVISTMVGCTSTMRFYPVQGSLSNQRPVPVFFGKMTARANSREMSVVLNNGELCKGRWVQVDPPRRIKAGTSTTATTSNDMSSVWDTVYGPGFYISHVLGTRLYARAVLSGDQGTVMNVEVHQPHEHAGDPGAIKGVAKDNKDNIYKITS